MYDSKQARNLIRRYYSSCPYEIAGSLRIHVRFDELPKSVRGFYSKTLGQRFIVISNDLPSEWQRFVCAHELGHAVLHPGTNHYFLTTQPLLVPGKYEREANRFACDLLTEGEVIRESEPLEAFYSRCKIPREIIEKM